MTYFVEQRPSGQELTLSNWWQPAEKGPTQTLTMAKAPPPHPRISCMASTYSWTTAHLNTSRVLSLNRGQSIHPKHAWKVFLIHSSPNPLLGGRLWPSAQISSSLGMKHTRKEASVLGTVLFWWKGHTFHHICKPFFFKSCSYPIFYVCEGERRSLELHHSCGLRNLFHNMYTLCGVWDLRKRQQSKEKKEV